MNYKSVTCFQSKGRILRPALSSKSIVIVDYTSSWDREFLLMNKEPKLSKAGSGCSIKGTKYKWRLSVPWGVKKKLNLSSCRGKFYNYGGSILFTNRQDAEYFYLRSF